MSTLHVKTLYRFRECKKCEDRTHWIDTIYHHSADGFGVYVKQCQSCKEKIFNVSGFLLDTNGIHRVFSVSWIKHLWQKPSVACVAPVGGRRERRWF